MNVGRIMTQHVKTCRAQDSLQAAARIMWENDCGIVPVVDQESRMVGVITDRDICMAAMFNDLPLSNLQVENTMSTEVFSCRSHDPLEVVEQLMRMHQVHRLPVTDKHGALVGIVSLNDIALEAEHERQLSTKTEIGSQEIAATLASICEHRRSSQIAAA